MKKIKITKTDIKKLENYKKYNEITWEEIGLDMEITEGILYEARNNRGGGVKILKEFIKKIK